MKVLELQLELQEPVLVSKPGIDPNTDESLNYLPGSVIRGAIASQFAREHRKNGAWDAALFRRLFLGEEVRFLNAYPARDGQRLLPTPAHWAVEKDPIDPANQLKVIDQSYPATGEIKQTTSLGGAFHRVDNANHIVHTQGVQFEVAVHNARERKMGRAVPDDRTNRSALFRYQALAKGQTFVARIMLKNDADEAHLASYLQGMIWLGRSTSAGYGRTQITQCSEAKMAREIAWNYKEIPANTPFLLYFTSDAILRHPQNGQTGAYLLEALQQQCSNHTVSFAKDTNGDHHLFNKMGWVGGFNVKWGLPLPQTWAILKGNVSLLQCDQTLTAKDVQNLEEAGLGERIAEGFGSLIIASQEAWPANLTLPRERETAEQDNKNTLQFDALEKEESMLLQGMNERIAKQELDRHLASALNGMVVKQIRLSNSQMARIRIKVKQKGEDAKDPFAPFRTYLEGTEKRKSADDQFRKSRLGAQTLRDWLLTVINEPTKTWDQMGLHKYEWQSVDGKWQRRLLGETPYQLEAELAVEYTTRLIDGICERAQKQKEGN